MDPDSVGQLRGELAELRRENARLTAAAARRAELESALRASEDRLRLALAAGRLGSWEWDLASGSLTTSDEVGLMLGYPAGQVPPVERIIAERVAEEDAAAVRQAIANAVGGGGSYDLDVQCRVIWPDGELRWIDLRGRVLPDETGRPGRLAGTLADVTEHKRTEQDLLESQYFIRQMAEASPVSILVYDLDAERAVYANRVIQDQLGLSPRQIRELTAGELRALCHPDDAGRLAEHRRRLSELADGEIQSIELRIRHADGAWRWLETQAVVFSRAEDGRVSQLLGATIDVTRRRQAEEDRRRLEAQVQHAQKLESLGVLAGGIAHDFNNLLVAILGNASVALLNPPTNPASAAALTDIQTAAQRAADLTRQLLAYSGKGRFVIESLDLNVLVREMVLLLNTAVAKSAVLRFDLTAELPAIEGDATQLRQVVMNLITNASDALGDQPGLISIRTGQQRVDEAYLRTTFLNDALPPGRYVFVEVVDSGQGMDEATRRRIFDPFFTTKFTGRGLGLAAVLGIVRGHQGAIKVYSEPDKGTSFKVLFPCSPATVSGARPAQPCSEPERWRGRGTILIVDDEPSIRLVAQRMVEHFGFTALTAVDGEDAVAVYRQRGAEIALVLMDLTMPRLDGEGAYRELQRLDPTVRVVLSSGFNEQDATHRFAGSGLAGFIQKPYRAADLQDCLRRALGE
jgi:PAS domain S-box-containing protein